MLKPFPLLELCSVNNKCRQSFNHRPREKRNRKGFTHKYLICLYSPITSPLEPSKQAELPLGSQCGMSQVSRAHKLQLGGDWLFMHRPRPGLLNDRSRSSPLSLLLKKFTTRHTRLQRDVRSQAFYSGDCGLRIELPNTGQMDSQGLSASTIQVTV